MGMGRAVVRAQKSPGRSAGKDAADDRARDKQRQILDAAVRVFARKGFHAARISDIAKEAGVAYGLVYHYFTNKEEVLNSIFQRNWSVVVKMMESVEQQHRGLKARLTAIVDFMMNVYKISPETVDLLVLEFGRSSRLAQTVRHPQVDRSWTVLQHILEAGQADGEVRTDTDARLLTTLFLGMVETGLAAFVTRMMQRDDAMLEEMKRAIVSTFVEGVAPRGNGGR
ncbi:MAG: TetR/AcrR family transcriptional regulator [Deltaproteobacteria bacterium]|nr:TetR/AcrR family transcriptional regulator [Deltaproteobacteria bacterium]